jgi:hypothetical protein
VIGDEGKPRKEAFEPRQHQQRELITANEEKAHAGNIKF